MIYDVSGVDLTDLGLGAVDGKVGKALNVLKRVRRVKKLKKQMGVQLSYSFGPTANLVNVLSRHRDVIWTGIRGYGALSGRGAMKLICSLSDRVVSCTKVMERQIDRQFHPKQSAAVYNPCDIDDIREKSRMGAPQEFDSFFARRGKTVVSMGREHDVKGFWHLIKAVYLVRKEMPEVKLMIVGAGEYQEYRTLARQLGMEDDVLFTGVQQNPFALLAKADVYALTSESEGFPNALIEAMACGLPCISVNCLTGPAEILHGNFGECADQDKVYRADYGILTGVFRGGKDMDASHFTVEEERFAGELGRLLDDERLYDHYKAAAQRRAGYFGTEKYLEDISRLIGEDL